MSLVVVVIVVVQLGLVREREGDAHAAAAVLSRAQLDASLEVAQARRGIAAAASLVTTAEASRALAARTEQLSRRAFDVGRGSSLELVQSAAALRAAELTLALRELELVQARLDAFFTEAVCAW